MLGLVHGFRFARALSQIGLTQGQIPLALPFYNLGVELGQPLFIAVVLSLPVVWRRIRMPLPRAAGLAAPYTIGSVAMFRVIQRVVSF